MQMLRDEWGKLGVVARLGAVFVLLSVVCFVLLPIFPFLPMFADAKAKAGATFALFIAAEVLFYGGLALMGKDVYARLQSHLRNRKQQNTARQREESVEPPI